ENWIEHTKELDTVLPIIFIGSNLKESYKVYEFDHISFVYKEKMNYFDFALTKAKELYSNSLGKFYYRCKNTVYIESLSDILYFETDKRRTIIHRRDGSTVYTYKNMEEFVNEIKHHFIRIHKKFFINQSDFKKIKRDKVQMINGITLTISRPYISFMNQYKIEK
ncbi:MAG: LytTR family transcriptional regulator DNA-binding domain-containing protein, partial [Floccifex sp.]